MWRNGTSLNGGLGSTPMSARPTASMNPSGAIVSKARSLLVHSAPEAQREDLLQLFSSSTILARMAAGISSAERRWLRQAGARLNRAGLSSLVSTNGQRAAQAYQLLVAEPQDLTASTFDTNSVG